MAHMHLLGKMDVVKQRILSFLTAVVLQKCNMKLHFSKVIVDVHRGENIMTKWM